MIAQLSQIIFITSTQGGFLFSGCTDCRWREKKVQFPAPSLLAEAMQRQMEPYISEPDCSEDAWEGSFCNERISLNLQSPQPLPRVGTACRQLPVVFCRSMLGILNSPRRKDDSQWNAKGRFSHIHEIMGSNYSFFPLDLPIEHRDLTYETRKRNQIGHINEKKKKKNRNKAETSTDQMPDHMTKPTRITWSYS